MVVLSGVSLSQYYAARGPSDVYQSLAAALRAQKQPGDGVLLIDGQTPGAHTQVGPSDLSEILLRALVDSCTFGTHDRETSFVMSKQARDIA